MYAASVLEKQFSWTHSVWDPTEPVATRPLFTQRGTGYKFFYTCDGNKNVSELVHFETRNGIAAHYDYAPFGAVTRAISASAVTDNTFTTDNPFRFSSEYHDDTLGLVYYNYRHYNPIDGRWCGRDPLDISVVLGAYCYLSNKTLNVVDMRGLDLLDPGRSAHSCMSDKSMYWHRVVNNAFEAWENWRSNVGGVAEAGEGLISKIKNSSGYINMLETTSFKLRELLKGKTYEELMLMNDTGGPFGAYTSNNAIGGISYWFNISNIRVNLREIDNNMCRLEYRVEGMFEFTDIYTFKWEKDLPIRTFFSDVVPSILAGSGTPYKIHGEWPEVFVLWWSN